jgi:hypothetical protein
MLTQGPGKSTTHSQFVLQPASTAEFVEAGLVSAAGMVLVIHASGLITLNP